MEGLAQRVAGNFEDRRSRESEQSVLGVLYQLTITGGNKEGIIWLPQNRRAVLLAQSLSEVINDGCLEVRGRFSQNGVWDVGVVETGCASCGILWVGPDFEDEYKRRPDSMIGEMLLKMSEVAFMDSRNKTVGNFKSHDEVREVVAGYLKTFPSGVPMTEAQIYLASYYRI